jgi:hypothetical protein
MRIESGVFGDFCHELVVVFGFSVKSGHSTEFRDKIKRLVFLISGYNKRLLGIFDFNRVVLLIIIDETHLHAFNLASGRLSEINISNSVDTMVSIRRDY